MKDKDGLEPTFPDTAVTAGGWCAPSEALYDIGDPGVAPGPEVYGPIPALSVQREGIDFTDRRTDAEKAAAEAMQAFIHRKVGTIMEAQRDAMNEACLHAMANGWDIHVYRHPWKVTRFIGISLTPQEHVIPTIHEHRTDHTYEWWNEDDD